MKVGALRTPLAVLLELAWTFAAVAVFVRVFGQGDGPAPSLALAAVIVGGSFLLARGLQATDLDEQAIRMIGLGVSVPVIFIAARIEYAPDEWPFEMGWLWSLLTDGGDALQPNAHVVAGLVALVPFWLRGIMRGQASEIEFDDVLTSASLGLVPVLIAALTRPDTREASAWGAYAFGYCVLALVTLAVFRAPEPDAPLRDFLQRWSWGFGALAGAAFGVALFALAVDPDSFGFLAPVGEALRPVGRAFGNYVLEPIFWVISLPFRLLWWIVGLFTDTRHQQPQPQPTPDKEPKPDESQPLWFRVVATIAAVFGVIGVLVAGMVLLWYTLRRFARGNRRDERDRYDEIEPESSLADDIGAMLGAFGRRFRRQRAPSRDVAVRRLYDEVLRDAASRGLERPPATTPAMFTPALETQFTPPLPGEITQAFMDSRYGEREIDDQQVAELRRRWQDARRPT